MAIVSLVFSVYKWNLQGNKNKRIYLNPYQKLEAHVPRRSAEKQLTNLGEAIHKKAGHLKVVIISI